MLFTSDMSTNKTLSKKLSLSTQTLRVLTPDELNGIAGGAGDSNQSICIGNGKTNQANSVLGYCPTIRPQPQTKPGK